MANFQREGGDRGGRRDGGKGGDRGSRGGFEKRSFTGGRRGDNNSQMHKATCGECGKGCEVPFRPTGEKPVFCRDCFASKRDATSKYSRDEPRNVSSSHQGSDNSDIKDLLESINTKLSVLSASIDKLSKSQDNKKEEKTVAVEYAETPVKKTSAKKVVKDTPVKKVAAKKAVAKVTKKVVAKKK